MNGSPIPSPNSLRMFSIQNGVVMSDSGQQDADDFAADFQGLRHFADKIGAALDLGPSYYSTIHEDAYSFMYLLPQDADEQAHNATGTMIASNVTNNELLNALQQHNA